MIADSAVDTRDRGGAMATRRFGTDSRSAIPTVSGHVPGRQGGRRRALLQLGVIHPQGAGDRAGALAWAQISGRAPQASGRQARPACLPRQTSSCCCSRGRSVVMNVSTYMRGSTTNRCGRTCAVPVRGVTHAFGRNTNDPIAGSERKSDEVPVGQKGVAPLRSSTYGIILRILGSPCGPSTVTLHPSYGQGAWGIRTLRQRRG